MPARILAANQSPTLLNNLAQVSDLWTIQVKHTEAHDTLSETSLGLCEEWDGDQPDQFWACAGHHVHWARTVLPGVEIVYFLHNGRRDDGEAAKEHFRGLRVVCMSQSNALTAATVGGARSVHFLSPAYEDNPVWAWLPGIAWSTMSRPSTRDPRSLDIMRKVTESCSAVRSYHVVYGQDQPAGFLCGAKKRAFLQGSSCYASFVRDDSGFGLAEHEAMAAGVPVIAQAWGDLPAEYPGHPGLCGSPEEVADKVARCCADKDFADSVSEAGLEYIRRSRGINRLRDSVRVFLAG